MNLRKSAYFQEFAWNLVPLRSISKITKESIENSYFFTRSFKCCKFIVIS
jgi:hypothetical protein